MGSHPAGVARLGLWLTHDSPSLVEAVVAESTADFVVLDAQHGAFGPDALLGLLRAGVPLVEVEVKAGEAGEGSRRKRRPKVWVRLASVATMAADVGRVLDAGAHGVIAPMVSSRADADALAAAAAYPPLGRRSFGPYRARITSPASAPPVETLAMIETREALANLDAILDSRVSGIFLGPNDLCLCLGFPPTSAPTGEVLRVMLDCAARARAKGKTAGVFCSDPVRARDMLRAGFDFVVVTTDQRLVVRGAEAALADARL